MRSSIYGSGYWSLVVIALGPLYLTHIRSPEASSILTTMTSVKDQVRQSVMHLLASNLAMWLSKFKHSESDSQYGWWWDGSAVGSVSMRKLCLQAGGTLLGGSNRSANDFPMHSILVSMFASLHWEASSYSYSIWWICTRVTKIKISDASHFALNSTDTMLITDVWATVLHWAWTTLNHAWWGRIGSSDFVTIVEGWRVPCCKYVQSCSSIGIVLVLW